MNYSRSVKILVIIIFTVVFSSCSLFSKPKITGRVVDQQGKSIKGVKVVMKDSTLSTETNSKGEFSLNMVEGHVAIQAFPNSDNYLDLGDSRWGGSIAIDRYPTGRDIGKLVLHDKSLIKLHLTVKDQHGNPLSDITVATDPSIPDDIRTDKNGNITFNWFRATSELDYVPWKFTAFPPSKEYTSVESCYYNMPDLNTIKKSISAKECSHGLHVGDLELWKIDQKKWQLSDIQFRSIRIELVKDLSTGLTWTCRDYKNANVAQELSKLKTQTGYTWRLPTYSELLQLYNNLPSRNCTSKNRQKDRCVPPFKWVDIYANHANYLTSDHIQPPKNVYGFKNTGAYRTLNFIKFDLGYVRTNTKGLCRFVMDKKVNSSSDSTGDFFKEYIFK